MKKDLYYHISFWILAAILLVLYFGRAEQDYIQSFYFTTFLLPVALGTVYVFNYFLVPRYLLTGNYLSFALYLVYLIIVSLYLQMLVITLSFILLANYQYQEMNPLTVDVFSLGITLFLIVFVVAFFRMLRSVRHLSAVQQDLKVELQKNEKRILNVISERKQIPIDLDQLIYIESLADYVKLITVDQTIITRQKISQLQQDIPANFVRIHRSFIINKHFVQSYNREEVELTINKLPISRTYKKSAIESLEK